MTLAYCCFFRNDWWISCGISGYLAGLFCRKSFGHTEYTHWVVMEQRKVCEYELEHILPPLCASLSPLQIAGMYICHEDCTLGYYEILANIRVSSKEGVA